ncbi:helix-turn-helix transcriptional regulator [Leucobacter sp. 1207-22]
MVSIQPASSWNQYVRELGVELPRRRLDAGLTQEQLAHRAGLTRTHYQQVERGYCKKNEPANPSLKLLVRIAQALGVEVAELLPPTARIEWGEETKRSRRFAPSETCVHSAKQFEEALRGLQTHLELCVLAGDTGPDLIVAVEAARCDHEALRHRFRTAFRVKGQPSEHSGCALPLCLVVAVRTPLGVMKHRAPGWARGIGRGWVQCHQGLLGDQRKRPRADHLGLGCPDRKVISGRARR